MKYIVCIWKIFIEDGLIIHIGHAIEILFLHRGHPKRQNFSITPVIAALRARCTLIERHVVVDWHKSFFDGGGKRGGRYRGSKIFEYRRLHRSLARRSIGGARFRKQIHQIEIEETGGGAELQIRLETRPMRWIYNSLVWNFDWNFDSVLVRSIEVSKYWKYWFSTNETW